MRLRRGRGVAAAAAAQQPPQPPPPPPSWRGHSRGAAAGAAATGGRPESEWRAALTSTESDAALAKRLGASSRLGGALGASQRQIGMRVSQVARARSRGKGAGLLEQLRKMEEAVGPDPSARAEAAGRVRSPSASLGRPRRPPPYALAALASVGNITPGSGKPSTTDRPPAASVCRTCSQARVRGY